MEEFSNSTLIQIIKESIPFCNVTITASVPFSRRITGRYLFPPLFVVGVIGNALNLCVLNSRGMRHKTNVFLSAMAMSDLCFLICSLPMELITFNSFIYSHRYMSFYVNTRMTWTALLNWFSAASIWIAVLVTVERVIAIKAPLQAKFWWKSHKIVITLILVYLSSFLASCYNFIWMSPVITHICGDVYKYGLKTINGTVMPNLNAYVQFSLLVTPFLIVTVPTILLVVLNSCLLYYLYRNRENMACQTNTPHQRQGNEFRVTCTVSIIVLSFIVFTSPSAVLFIYEAVHKSRAPIYMEAVIFANLLVIVGKSVNFVLYCSVSDHFRRRLVALLCRKTKFFSRSLRDNSTNSRDRRRSTLTSLLGLIETRNFNSLLNFFPTRKNFTHRARSASSSFVPDNHVRQREMTKLIDPLRKKEEICYRTDRRMTHPIEAPHH